MDIIRAILVLIRVDLSRKRRYGGASPMPKVLKTQPKGAIL